ncbi:hypothetical protein EZ449_04405 [Pedobacter frigidisoli]|uniref:Uncharacterized protein n=1 Tax=Pedobacter frigidisoli TaxID=2530455 RepID=A0A4R0P6I5_9SPHI|nr:hypothetical protein [Pedobacter frigidisoli]TCD11511.1 hypothetical protein EZ449_04405 [Pedobacter frigidisoli]
MKHFFYILIIIVFTSCNSEKKESAQAVIATPTGLQGLQKSTVAAPVKENAKSSLIFNPPHGQAGHTCDLAVGAPLNRTVVAQPQQNTTSQPATTNVPVQAVTNTSGQKLNPKHGEPNHRCDIAVGAPLNSKPVQVAQTNIAQPTVINQPVVAKVGKGLNPPHGQPNHRCDIAVGAPLNAKPVQAAKSVAAPSPMATPEAKTLEAKNGVMLNPKHGEPNHRCDIAVGAPLS